VAVLSGDHYGAILANLHSTLRPRTYVEIGVWAGESLKLAQTDTTAIGIDPQPRLENDLPNHIRVVQAISDDFFRTRTELESPAAARASSA
jgi:hypothetical protein